MGRSIKKHHDALRDPAYLEWIRQQPCLICVELQEMARGFVRKLAEMSPNLRVVHDERVTQQKSRTEAAHTGPHGMSQKAPDREALPLCGIEHHREGPYSIHKLGKRFFEHWNLDRDPLVCDYRERYEKEMQWQKQNLASSAEPPQTTPF